MRKSTNKGFLFAAESGTPILPIELGVCRINFKMVDYLVQKFFLFDPLALFFTAVIVLVSVPSLIYAFGYLKSEAHKPKIALAWVLLVLFCLSMVLVVTVRNAFHFLIAWEIMSLVSYFLVVFDTTHEKSIQAGTIYIVMTHMGTAFLIAAILLIHHFSHSFDTLAMKAAVQSLPAQTKNLLFVFFLIGFGTKAGIVPLHIWLPYAHPQAPSPASGLMSGVMIKTAVYGLIRYVLFILGASSSWWGILLLVLASVSCLVGIVYALTETDIKRLLAYSSVENMGIVLLGVGLSLFFASLNVAYLAVFSLMAGLYHLVNHAIFKSLLFLSAGSVYQATGTRHIEKLGGLIKKMPQTAFCFLCGAMAISALPPFNGFVSEWLMLQALFLGAFHVVGGYKFFLGVCASVLALTGGLAAACFVKAFGITFLAQPRSRYAYNAKEVSRSMRIGTFSLSVLALGFGLAAVLIVKLLSRVSGAALGVDATSMSFALNNFILRPQAGQATSLSPFWIALLLILCGASMAIPYFLLGRKKACIGKTWDCGYYSLDSRNEYTATAYSKPFRIAFSFFLRPYRRTQKIRESFYHVKSFVYETRTTHVFNKYIYKPVLAVMFGSARIVRRIQPGSIQLYLSYIFVTLCLLVIFMHKF